jgi:hypothetical protein
LKNLNLCQIKRISNEDYGGFLMGLMGPLFLWKLNAICW